MTREGLPETLYLVPDWEYHEAHDTWRAHGTIINGTPIVIEELVTTRYDGKAPTCEVCRERREDAYRLADEDDIAGIPLCRDCLEEQGWIKEIVEDKTELDNNVDVPSSHIPLPDQNRERKEPSPLPAIGEAPERLYIVPHLNSEGFDIWEFHGQTIHGTPVVIVDRVHTDDDQEALCEVCGEPRENVYQLADEHAPGVTVCLDHLNESVWVDTIHTTWRTVMFDETPVPEYTEPGADRALSEI